jgi:hypothetical protein
MIRIVDKNSKYVVQKVVSVATIKLDEMREAVKEEFLRYQVVPLDSIGNTAAVEVCATLQEARELVKKNMEAW